ncbi:MAG TPA: RNA 2',3'-cyclic phosphodiesterase [Acholeplasmataceae bacterium]|nr:RNA 2',3'-cyclic phosphodiesterase [Acholeplasmataceae bacterium]
MRIFIGIKPEDCLKEILEIQESFRSLSLPGNYTFPDNIHMTLLFLGELDEAAVSAVKVALRQIEYPRFDIHINKLKNLRDMIVLEAAREPELMELQEKVRLAVAGRDIRTDDRPFYPHITLIRQCNHRTDEPVRLKTMVREVILFSSERINNRLTYVPLFQNPFRGKDA